MGLPDGIRKIVENYLQYGKTFQIEVGSFVALVHDTDRSSGIRFLILLILNDRYAVTTVSSVLSDQIFQGKKLRRIAPLIARR
jgi:hypothetical protein